MKYLDKDGLEYAWKKIQTYLDKKTNNADLLDKIYPVGSIYLTMGDTSPADLFGGTWKKLSGGYLYANSSNAGNTGGSHTINITTANLPSHSHSIPSHTHSIPSHTHSIPSHNHGYTRADSVGYHTVTTNEMPSHNHGQVVSTNGGNSGRSDYNADGYGAPYAQGVTTEYSGGGASHNHGLSTSWQSSGNWSGTTGSSSGNTGSTGGTSGATGSGTEITFYPEYINVYMWQRTA